MSAVPLPIRVERRTVLRWLGYPPGAQPRPRIAQRLDELWDEAAELAQPSGAWRFAPHDLAAACAMPEPSARVALGVCTVGPELTAPGRSALDALILDAWGTAAVESAADALEAQACTHARAEDLHAGRRISPGYGAWPVAANRALLRLLPTRAVGVALSEGGMMVPSKSVSFGVRLHPEPRPAQATQCAACHLTACTFRTRT